MRKGKRDHLKILKAEPIKRILELGIFDDGENAIAMIRASQAKEEEIEYHGFCLDEKKCPEIILKIKNNTKARAFIYPGDYLACLDAAQARNWIEGIELVYVQDREKFPEVYKLVNSTMAEKCHVFGKLD